MFYDWTYVCFVLPAVIFSLWASANVNRTFSKYSKIYSQNGMTGAEAARAVLLANGISYVKIERVNGKLTDHFDPKTGVIRLSDSVYDNTSVAAIGVACHEAGHAMQYAEDYMPIKIRNMIIPITNIGSRLSIPLIVLGLILYTVSDFLIIFAYIGIVCFGLSTIFQLVTLPTEFNASRRAMRALDECKILYANERKSAGKVLSAAAMTYVAALAVSIMQLLRLLSVVNSRRNK